MVLAAAVVAAVVGRLRLNGQRSGWPVLTLGVGVILAGCLALQLAMPETLALMRRDGPAIAQGQIWRLFTALWFQDHGVIGGGFNLVLLAMIGPPAETVWGRARWLLIYFVVGLICEVLALTWQPIGAGNSIAVLGLAGGLFALSLRRPAKRPDRWLAVAGLALGVGLAALRDIHGAAILLGGAAGWLLMLTPTSRVSDAPPLR
jgi:rhomboid protease GluP